MDRMGDLPFPVGQYVDSIQEGLLGKIYVIEDSLRNRQNQMVKIMLVKNGSGAAVLPKRLCKMKTGAANGFNSEVAGMTTVDAEDSYPADEGLPSSGVPDQNYFYVVVGGPALVKTSLAGDARNVINEGDWLVSVAGATTGATSGGRAQAQNIAAATTANAVNATQIQRAIGRAMSNATTNNTDADLLVWMGGRWGY